MPKLNAHDLDRLYVEADSIDQEIFSEMRSNILLVSGDHYQKKGSKFWNRIRNTEDLDQTQKLRLTKNHIKNLTQSYVSNILTHAPASTVIPNNPEEIQDQKTAELNKSILDFYKKTLNLRAKTREKGEDFVTFGEVWSKTFFDPDRGKIKGYEPLIDEYGQELFNENGEPIPDESKPVMEGEFIVERILPFNVLRAPEAQTLDESPYIIIRKMMRRSEVKAMIPEEERDRVLGSSEETYLVFNGNVGTYERTKNEIMVREHYYRPTKKYPNGYFYIATQDYIIFEGELPNGQWPLCHSVFDSIPTSPRGRSPIKQMRPYQVEINRAASAIATAQITLGDDKLVMSYGARMGHGGQVPGVRGISLSGSGDVKVLPGRSGEQYVPYMEGQIRELYAVMGVKDVELMNKEGKLDPYALLYQSIRNRRKFSRYTEAFEEFTISECELLLNLAKFYLEPDTIIPIVGRGEIVNIAEFKHSDPNRYRLTVKPIDNDAETMLGKQLALNHTLQYVGNSLDKKDIGRIIRNMPYLNQEEIIGDLTLDYDNARNDMLAMERGEIPQVNPYDNHEYTIKALVNRMKKPDFKFLDPKIKQIYTVKLQAHEMLDVQQKEKIMRMQQGLIPIDGYLVTCDFYVSKGDGKTKRVRLPYGAVNWLIQQLKQQGHTLEQLESMNMGVISEEYDIIKQRGLGMPSDIVKNQGVLNDTTGRAS